MPPSQFIVIFISFFHFILETKAEDGEIKSEEDADWNHVEISDNQIVRARPSNQGYTTLSSVSDKSIISTHCKLVKNMRVFPGWLDVSRDFACFTVDFDELESFKDNESSQISGHIKQEHTWDLSKVAAVYRRRYLLKHTGIELFFRGGRKSAFWVFDRTKTIKQVLQKLSGLVCKDTTVIQSHPEKWINKLQLTKSWHSCFFSFRMIFFPYAYFSCLLKLLFICCFFFFERNFFH